MAGLALKIVVIGWMLYSNISSSQEGQKLYGELATPAPLSGLYEVQSFERNNKAVAPLLTDSTLWHKLLVHKFPAGWGRITMANEKLEYCTFIVDTIAHQIDLHSVRDTSPNLFAYEQPNPESLIIRGMWKQDSLSIRFKKIDAKYELLNSGFHWVNEYPNNQ